MHEYLGMIMGFSTRGEVIIDMVKYLEEMRQGFGKDLSESAKTPAAAHLLQVREDAEKLCEEKAKKFHHTVAQGLLLSKRARVDFLTTIAFLATRVKEPDVDDWKKLVRMMRYLNNTKRWSGDLRQVVLVVSDGILMVHIPCMMTSKVIPEGVWA